MKKLFMFMFALLTCSLMQAQGLVPKERIIFSVRFYEGGIEERPISSPMPKSPEDAPEVYIEENVLYFEGDHPAYDLTIRDEDGDAVYTTTVSASDTVVTLPSTLSGTYEIELVYNDLLFTGWIEL